MKLKDMKQGVWLIKDFEGGRHYTHIGDGHEAAGRVVLESHRYIMTNIIATKLLNPIQERISKTIMKDLKLPSARDVVSAMITAIEEAQYK